MATITQLRAILRKYKDDHKVNYSKLKKHELLALINKLGLSHLIPPDQKRKMPIYTQKKYNKAMAKLADVYKRLHINPS
jgi:hypothetical protein